MFTHKINVLTVILTVIYGELFTNGSKSFREALFREFRARINPHISIHTLYRVSEGKCLLPFKYLKAIFNVYDLSEENKNKVYDQYFKDYKEKMINKQEEY